MEYTARENQAHAALALAHSILHQEWLEVHKVDGNCDKTRQISSASNLILEAMESLGSERQDIAI